MPKKTNGLFPGLSSPSRYPHFLYYSVWSNTIFNIATTGILRNDTAAQLATGAFSVLKAIVWRLLVRGKQRIASLNS